MNHEWAKLEIKGFSVRYGRTQETERFGVKGCLIEVPHGIAKIENSVEQFESVEFVPGTSIHHYTILSEEVVRERLKPWAPSTPVRALPMHSVDDADTDDDEIDSESGITSDDIPM